MWKQCGGEIVYMPRGRPPKKDKELQENQDVNIQNKKGIKSTKDKYTCFYCGKEYVNTNFYNSNSGFYNNIGKIPHCKQCIENFYQQYFEKYKNEGCLIPEKKAIQRLCMIFDFYYSDNVYNAAMNDRANRNLNISPMGAYMKMVQLQQHKDKSYEDTITEAEQENFAMASISEISSETTVDQNTRDFFGSGFVDEDYKFLKKEYEDWTARHECNTKAQEEIFKRICFKQLEILKATRKGEDTKNLDATFQNLLDTAKLQPKQNAGETISDAQTYGTLIDKWENTRPIPDAEDEFKDVDKIGLLIHTFYTGHMAKVLNLPTSLTAIYDKFIKQYTVEKQEYEGESNNEALFNNIFGKKNIDE